MTGKTLLTSTSYSCHYRHSRLITFLSISCPAPRLEGSDTRWGRGREKIPREGEFTLRTDPWAGLIASTGSFYLMVYPLPLSARGSVVHPFSYLGLTAHPSHVRSLRVSSPYVSATRRSSPGSFPRLSFTPVHFSSPGGLVPRAGKKGECWTFLDWRLNSENDSPVHGQPSSTSPYRLLTT